MSIPASLWQLQTLDPVSALNPHTQQIHHAAQFIALMGHSYLPKEADDSHTNIEWVNHIGGLIGHEIHFEEQIIRVGLVYHPFELHIYDQNMDSIDYINLEGSTIDEGMEWLKTQVINLGGQTDQLQAIQHYDLPEHELHKGGKFYFSNPVYILEIIKYRSNADYLLKLLVDSFDDATDVRIWPHHFDSGSLIITAKDDQDQVLSYIGIGLAIADQLIDEYYYYVSFSSKESEIDFSSLPPLQYGRWGSPDFPGAILEMSSLLQFQKAEEQMEASLLFFNEAINLGLDLMGKGKVELSTK